MPNANTNKITNGFQLGLLGGLGVLTALLLGNAIVSIASILTYVFASIFIALGLEPIVAFLISKGVKRFWAIPIVVVTLLVLLGGLVAALAPTLVEQTGHLITVAPDLLQELSTSSWLPC